MPASAAAHLIRFELAMLAELGFGLDLENCAATGATADLIYVSPKSGGAVSRRAGEPWRDRLLRLPPFLREGEGGANGWSDQDLQDGFRLTGLFLLRHVLEPRGQGHSDARDGFINAVTRNRARISSASWLSAVPQRVVPANAGTHTPRPINLRCGPSHFSPQTPVVMGPCVRRDDSWGVAPLASCPIQPKSLTPPHGKIRANAPRK